MKWIAICLIAFSINKSYSQAIDGLEIGLDGFFGSSTLGGSFGLGPKIGIELNENLVVGPTFRFNRYWSSEFGSSNTNKFNMFGAGVFIHGRYKNAVFGGLEFEMIQSRSLTDFTNLDKIWVPTAFLCAGFSREFSDIVRVNIGFYYDLFDNDNSPFRGAYILTVKDQNGNIVDRKPLMYRLSFYFPIIDFKKKKSKSTEEEEEWTEQDEQ
jgi:hypothetical protein